MKKSSRMEFELTELPKISVLMSVYNGEQYLHEAINSILNQTFADFEFIIVDDGSNDSSHTIIKSYDDKRIKYIKNEVNIGLSKSLNIAISLAKGKYIARMDADDLSYPERFAKQINFLDSNHDITICGTQMNELGKIYQVSNFPLTHNEMCIALLSGNPLAHPSVMWRKEDFDKKDFKYNEAYKTTQDYELWSRVLYKLKGANLNESLLHYRAHDNQVSANQSDSQRDNSIRVKLDQLKYFDLNPSEEEIGFHLCMFNNDFYFKRDANTIKKVDEWMYNLYLKNVSLGIFEEGLFFKLWRERFFGKGLYQYNLSIWSVLKKSYCKQYCNISAVKYYKQFLKCILTWSN